MEVYIVRYSVSNKKKKQQQEIDEAKDRNPSPLAVYVEKGYDWGLTPNYILVAVYDGSTLTPADKRRLGGVNHLGAVVDNSMAGIIERAKRTTTNEKPIFNIIASGVID